MLKISGGVWSLNGKSFVKSEISVDLQGSSSSEFGDNELAAITVPKDEAISEYKIAHEAGIALAKNLADMDGLIILHGAKAEVQQIRESSPN